MTRADAGVKSKNRYAAKRFYTHLRGVWKRVKALDGVESINPPLVIAQMASINTPTIRRLLRWTVPAFWSSADTETWMLGCHWLIARYLCVYAEVYAAYTINPSPWNGTQTVFAYVCVDTRGDLRRSINRVYIPSITSWSSPNGNW